MSLATVGAALAPTAYVFIALQMISRLFMVTLAATAYVIVSEEIAAEHRGWGIGILGAFGVGLSAAAFSLIDVAPFGWRAMYVLGVVPLLLFPWLRRRVPETRRFEALVAERRAEPVAWWRSVSPESCPP